MASPIKLDFELLSEELRVFEAPVSQLKDSLNSLKTQLFRSSFYCLPRPLVVNKLETHDKSNLELFCLEFAKLQRKLEGGPIGVAQHAVLVCQQLVSRLHVMVIISTFLTLPRGKNQCEAVTLCTCTVRMNYPCIVLYLRQTNLKTLLHKPVCHKG